MALQKPFDAQQFEGLKKYGLLFFEENSNDDFVRVRLGTYLGKATALRILRKVQADAFPKAFLLRETFALRDEGGQIFTHSLQISSIKELDCRILSTRKIIDAEWEHQVFVQYSSGYYRLFLGLFREEDNARYYYFLGIAKGLNLADRQIVQKIDIQPIDYKRKELIVPADTDASKAKNRVVGKSAKLRPVKTQ